MSNKQPTLHNFFQITPVNKKTKSYFVMFDGHAEFLFEPPINSVFIGTKPQLGEYAVQLYSCIMLQSNVSLCKNDDNKSIQQSTTMKKIISLQKSNLQKAIRRKEIKFAISATNELIHIAPMELWRRLGDDY